MSGMSTSGVETAVANMDAASGSLPFYLLDVFAERRHEGNQLMVVVDEANTLDDARMLAITREINFAETAFVRGSPDLPTASAPQPRKSRAERCAVGLWRSSSSASASPQPVLRSHRSELNSRMGSG